MSELSEKDRLGRLKGDVKDFVELGLPFEQACKEAWLTDEEISEARKDKDFMDEIRLMTIDNKKAFLKEYNTKVQGSKNPQDALKILQAHFPEVFDPKQNSTDIPLQPVLISIGNGQIKEIPEVQAEDE